MPVELFYCYLKKLIFIGTAAHDFWKLLHKKCYQYIVSRERTSVRTGIALVRYGRAGSPCLLTGSEGRRRPALPVSREDIVKDAPVSMYLGNWSGKKTRFVRCLFIIILSATTWLTKPATCACSEKTDPNSLSQWPTCSSAMSAKSDQLVYLVCAHRTYIFAFFKNYYFCACIRIYSYFVFPLINLLTFFLYLMFT